VSTIFGLGRRDSTIRTCVSAALLNGRSAIVEDEENFDDIEAGPTLPPHDDIPDDEGRFFGEGIISPLRHRIDSNEHFVFNVKAVCMQSRPHISDLAHSC
jgi:hypothetical protein